MGGLAVGGMNNPTAFTYMEQLITSTMNAEDMMDSLNAVNTDLASGTGAGLDGGTKTDNSETNNPIDSFEPSNNIL